MLVFDLQETFDRLHAVLEQAQRVSPTAIRAVVGTKADLSEKREVATQEALVCPLLFLIFLHCISSISSPSLSSSVCFD